MLAESVVATPSLADGGHALDYTVKQCRIGAVVYPLPFISQRPFLMPIQIKCKCGKTLGIPDGMQGKSVKCPGCQQVLRVPAGGASKPVATPKPAAAPADDSMAGLFDEEGFSAAVEAVCPSCRAEMPGNAVLCTKCGYHKEAGATLEAHKTAGVDIDHGPLALDKAAVDMERAADLQKKMLRGAGLPWWGLALALFMLGSGLLIAVLAVNASRRVDEEISFNPMHLFLVLSGAAFFAISAGAYFMIILHAFKDSLQNGLISLFVPVFGVVYYAITHWSETWRFFITSTVLAGIGTGLIIAAMAQLN
ncbi:MAG: hypothetical protein L7W43_14275 [Rubripirellula sp.]|nr:hypothetical protein [Rubripirellula sp.]